MRIAFDIGGVISKFPSEVRRMMGLLGQGCEIFVLTDMHPREHVRATLDANGLEWLDDAHVLCSDYEQHGDACKAVLLREHRIDVFFDDHPGYLVWPWPTPAPLRLRVEPDPRRPYWHPSWKCDGGDFGRRYYFGD